MSSRQWLFTLNNPTTYTPFEFSQHLKEVTTAYIFQLEVGQNGTPHYQGFVQFANRRRLNGVKSLLSISTIHLEPRKGSVDQAIAYCSKEDTRAPCGTEVGLPGVSGEGWRLLPEDVGPHRYGEFTSQGSRTDLSSATALAFTGVGIKRVAEEYPEVFVKYPRGMYELCRMSVQPRRSPPLVSLLYGPTGVGKTRYVVEKVPFEQLYIKEPDTAWFDGLEDHTDVLFDDFIGKNCVSCTQLLRLLDRYNVQVAVKGAYRTFNSVTRIWITTNYHPREWYDWSNREESYKALERRIHQVIVFKERMPMRACKSMFFSQPLISQHDHWLSPVIYENYDEYQ